MFSISKALCIVSTVLICSSKRTVPVTYEVTTVGVGYVYAMGLNESNEVVGYVRSRRSLFNFQAFLWSVELGFRSIGGYTARGINERGQIAGNSGPYQAAVWEDGSWVPLSARQNAYSINDHGQVTGLISAQPFIPGPYAPFRDDDVGSWGFRTLVRPYPYASHGFDINNSGEVVADCGGVPNGLYVGVFYRSDASYVILDNDGNYDAHARAVNESGEIVGDSRISNGSDRLAVFWSSPESQMEYMGKLGEGAGVAFAINNSGHAVGVSSGRAFLWNRDEGMLDLNTAIDGGLGITLTRATDINDGGVIIAWGIDSTGRENSYLLTVTGK